MIVVRVAVPVVIGKRSELSDPARETDTDVENRGIDIAAGGEMQNRFRLFGPKIQQFRILFCKLGRKLTMIFKNSFSGH